MKYFKLGILFFFFSIFFFAYGEIDPGSQQIDGGFDDSHCTEQSDAYFEFQCIHGLSAFGPEGYSVCPERACTLDEMSSSLLLLGSIIFISLLVTGALIRDKKTRYHFIAVNAFSLIPAYWIYDQSWTESDIFQNVLFSLYICSGFFILILIVNFLKSADKNRYLLLFLTIFEVTVFYLFVMYSTSFYSYYFL